MPGMIGQSVKQALARLTDWQNNHLLLEGSRAYLGGHLLAVPVLARQKGDPHSVHFRQRQSVMPTERCMSQSVRSIPFLCLLLQQTSVSLHEGQLAWF